MKYLKAFSLFVIGIVLMKITNSIIHDLLLVNKPPGISLWRAYLASLISLIPLGFFMYKGFICIGWYKKEDFRLEKKNNYSFSKEIYAEALNEFENNRDEQLWTKYFAESDGDENIAKARYLRDRAKVLRDEGYKVNLDDLDELNAKEEYYQKIAKFYQDRNVTKK